MQYKIVCQILVNEGSVNLEHFPYVNVYILFELTVVGSTICSFKNGEPLSLTIAVVDHGQQLLHSVSERGLLSLQ